MDGTVGQRIRAARLARTPKMTLAELAGGDMSISLVSKIERGLVRPSLATLELLAERLGVHAGALIEGDAAAVAETRGTPLPLARAAAALAADDAAGALTELAVPPVELTDDRPGGHAGTGPTDGSLAAADGRDAAAQPVADRARAELGLAATSGRDADVAALRAAALLALDRDDEALRVADAALRALDASRHSTR